MVRIIFTNALGHSRSTVAGFYLSSIPNAIYLGEVNNFFINRPTNAEGKSHLLCSCGKKYEKCPFWSDYFNHEFKTSQEKYIWLVKRVKKFGYDVLVQGNDTGKEEYDMYKNQNLDITVFHLLRNPIGWSKSYVNFAKRFHKKSYPRVFYFIWWFYLVFRRYLLLKGGSVISFNNIEKLFRGRRGECHVAYANRCKFHLQESLKKNA